MKQDNFAVESLVLIQQKTIPDDATVVVIAGPTTDFFPPEIEALNAYVAKGGKVMVLLDPLLKGPAQPLLTQFLADWGIRAGTDVVLDASGMGQVIGTDASVPVAAPIRRIRSPRASASITAYPLARSMAPIEGGSNSHTAQPIVNTSPQSWSEADLAALSAARRKSNSTPTRATSRDRSRWRRGVGAGHGDAAARRATPRPASPDAERKPETRVVAIGDSDFAANTAIGIPGNRDFFMNSLNWLSQQENLIAVRPRQPEDRRLTMTADQQQRIMILTLFIIPGLVFATGIYTWWKRR